MGSNPIFCAKYPKITEMCGFWVLFCLKSGSAANPPILRKNLKNGGKMRCVVNTVVNKKISAQGLKSWALFTWLQ